MPEDGKESRAAGDTPDIFFAGGSPDQHAGIYTELVRQSRDGIILVLEDGSVAEWNPAMEQITGLASSDVIGKALWDVHLTLLPREKRTQDSLENLKNIIQSVFSDGPPADPGRSYEHEIICPDNRVRIIESRMFLVPAANMKMAGAILRDITDRRQAELAVQESNRKLNLMSSITRHDINNQLTIFNGYLSLLEAGTPSMKAEDIIPILKGATSKIQRILKFTKDYQEVGVKSPVWQDLGATIRLARTAVETGTVRFLPGPSCNDVEVFADPLLIRVFSNLIDNSIRHGEKVSEIRIRCTADNNRLVIVYEDDGIGISDRTRPILFERGKGRNTGYGLFLIREILSITGFTITETGEAGKGVRFGIAVPEGAFRNTGKNIP